MFNTFSKCLELAVLAHKGQIDKIGIDYINHPIAVATKIMERTNKEEVHIAAILHDVVEDTVFSMEVLRQLGVPEYSLEIVKLLTKNKGEPNIDYYRRIRKHEDAKLVKIADIEHNTSKWRIDLLDDPELKERLLGKYSYAMKALNFEVD